MHPETDCTAILTFEWSCIQGLDSADARSFHSGDDHQIWAEWTGVAQSMACGGLLSLYLEYKVTYHSMRITFSSSSGKAL